MIFIIADLSLLEEMWWGERRWDAGAWVGQDIPAYPSFNISIITESVAPHHSLIWGSGGVAAWCQCCARTRTRTHASPLLLHITSHSRLMKGRLWTQIMDEWMNRNSELILLLHGLKHGGPKLGGGLGDDDASIGEGLDLAVRSSLPSADDGSCMAHTEAVS